MHPSVLEEAKSAIEGIDFSLIIKKITTPDVNIARLWSASQALEGIGLYKNFLLLNKKYASKVDFKIVPSSEIDEIWHHHILDTRNYVKDCNSIFGEYFHHFPYFGARGEEDFANLQGSFAKTQDLYFAEFGDYIYEIFPTP